MEYQSVKTPIDQGNYLSFRPGARLKKAREALDLTIEQVAESLKILPRVLLAIEADQYKSLPEPVYVRGYLRLYAELVALPADEIIARFDEYYVADMGQPPSLALQSNTYKPLPVFVPRRLPLIKGKTIIILIVIAMVAVGVVAVWQSKLPQKMSAWIQKGSVPAVQPDEVMPSTNTISLPNTSTTLQAVDNLELTFTGETQVVIHDASGKELSNGLKKAGETLKVTGESPFAIELSQADVVQFRFNNSPIDLKPYTVNGAVNFRLSR